MDKRGLGKLGEEYVAKLLIKKSYKIIRKNFHSRFGEIDIIAYDQIKKELVFLEVKTRTNLSFGDPEDSITAMKKLKILKTIMHFFATAKEKHSSVWRIDVIAVKLNKQGLAETVKHYINI